MHRYNHSLFNAHVQGVCPRENTSMDIFVYGSNIPVLRWALYRNTQSDDGKNGPYEGGFTDVSVCQSGRDGHLFPLIVSYEVPIYQQKSVACIGSRCIALQYDSPARYISAFVVVYLFCGGYMQDLRNF